MWWGTRDKPEHHWRQQKCVEPLVHCSQPQNRSDHPACFGSSQVVPWCQIALWCTILSALCSSRCVCDPGHLVGCTGLGPSSRQKWRSRLLDHTKRLKEKETIEQRRGTWRAILGSPPDKFQSCGRECHILPLRQYWTFSLLAACIQDFLAHRSCRSKFCLVPQHWYFVERQLWYHAKATFRS